MSTGSIQNPAVVVMPDQVHDNLAHSFVNGSGGDLTQGMLVTLKTDGTVDKNDAGTELPIGVVIVGATDGNRVTVHMFTRVNLVAVAKGGTLNPGTLVVPNGNKDSDGRPEYVAAAVSEFAAAFVIKGGVVDSVITIGVFSSPLLNVPA